MLKIKGGSAEKGRIVSALLNAVGPSHITFVQAATSVSEPDTQGCTQTKARPDGGRVNSNSRSMEDYPMRTYDLTPFYRSTVGFDRLFSLLDQATADGSPGYPPYNIERTGENAYRISVAVSGFSQGELSIVAKENTLTIKGEKSANENGKDKSEVLYRGIAARAFERVFQLADFVLVKNASLENGLLHVDLVREIPEAKKPRSIPITHRRSRCRRWSTARPRRPPPDRHRRQALANAKTPRETGAFFCFCPALVLGIRVSYIRVPALCGISLRSADRDRAAAPAAVWPTPARRPVGTAALARSGRLGLDRPPIACAQGDSAQRRLAAAASAPARCGWRHAGSRPAAAARL